MSPRSACFGKSLCGKTFSSVRAIGSELSTGFQRHTVENTTNEPPDIKTVCFKGLLPNLFSDLISF